MICLHCNKTFKTKPALSTHIKFCNQNPDRETKSNIGGYREGSGRSKSGYYKGIYCGSTYELCWVIYQIDHNRAFERFKGCLERDNLKYFPDFIQGGKIIEIKGYEQVEKVLAKTELANSFGFEVSLLKREDLVNEFEWVKNNYTYTQLYELYDNFSPKFSYQCSYCGISFTRNKKLKSKTGLFFCSRTCSGKGSIGNKGKILSDSHKKKISKSLKKNTPVV